MTEQEFEEYLCKVKELSTDERRMLVDRLSHVDQQREVFDLIESHFNEQGCCPHCASVAHYRHGFANDLQRYRCRDCRRTFNALTATPLARLRKREHWLTFLTALIESRSVRRAAAALGVNAKTAFLLRHRFLAWISQDETECLRGITEADETLFSPLREGQQTPPARAA